jgi:hypothetical protein
MRTTCLAVLCVSSVFLVEGCLSPGVGYDANFPADTSPESPAATSVGVGEVDVDSYDGDDTAAAPAPHSVAVPVGWRGDRPRPAPVFFHLGAGYGALGRLDVLPCRDRGLSAGYVRIRATFRPSGRVAHAAVESPERPPEDALTCIGELLQATTVPPFDGSDVTLSRIYFVD